MVTAAMVKELRERTGVGMSKCKEALDEAKGDMEKAIELLRKAGMTSSVKKESRETKEGLISVSENEKAIAVLEINCETDFVAKNEKFKSFVESVSSQYLASKPKSLELFLKEKSASDPTVTVDQYRSLTIQMLGENIQIKWAELILKDSGCSYGLYSHMGGKIVTLVEISGEGEGALAREIAMHVAAESPEYLSFETVPEEVKKKEEEIARCQIKDKPANVIEKIVAGKVKAMCDQISLLNQKYVKDNNLTVGQFVEACGKKVNKSLKVTRFFRWQIGG